MMFISRSRCELLPILRRQRVWIHIHRLTMGEMDHEYYKSSITVYNSHRNQPTSAAGQYRFTHLQTFFCLGARTKDKPAP